LRHTRFLRPVRIKLRNGPPENTLPEKTKTI
jgi:hypothetical protein